LARATEVLGENLPQRHFVHHKPHMLCPDVNPGRRGGKPATNSLSFGTTHIFQVTGQFYKRISYIFHACYVPHPTIFDLKTLIFGVEQKLLN
jgi:hypothetical protein